MLKSNRFSLTYNYIVIKCILKYRCEPGNYWEASINRCGKHINDSNNNINMIYTYFSYFEASLKNYTSICNKTYECNETQNLECRSDPKYSCINQSIYSNNSYGRCDCNLTERYDALQSKCGIF